MSNLFRNGRRRSEKTADGLVIYVDPYAGEDYHIPADGIFNMGLKEAAGCAGLVGAKHNIIIHLKPGALFSRKKAEKWDAPNKIIIEPGDEINL